MMQTHKTRTIDQVTGAVIFVSDGATGVKVRGLRHWLNRPRSDFEDTRAPRVGEVWQFTFEVVERADGDVARFVRDEEYVETVELQQPPQPMLVTVPDQPSYPDRPSYEDAEWFWMIRDERGGVYAQTYKDYLASEAWHRRRDLRLKRDEHKCQARLPGCSVAATQVHHVTYNHLGCEPVWDLESVCNDCHALLTSIDRKQPMIQKNGTAAELRAG